MYGLFLLFACTIITSTVAGGTSAPMPWSRTSEIFDSSYEYNVFTINSQGDKYGAEECHVLERSSSRRKQHKTFNPRLYFEYGITQIKRSGSNGDLEEEKEHNGSMLNARVKVRLQRGILSPARSTVAVAVGYRRGDNTNLRGSTDTGADVVMFRHSQNLYEHTSGSSSDAVAAPAGGGVSVVVTPHPGPGGKFSANTLEGGDGEREGERYTGPFSPLQFDVYLHLDLFKINTTTTSSSSNSGNNGSLGFVPGVAYFVELQVQEAPSANYQQEMAAHGSSTGRGVVECVRATSIYTGLQPSNRNCSTPTPTSSANSTVVHNHYNTFTTNEYVTQELHTTNEYTLNLPVLQGSGDDTNSSAAQYAAASMSSLLLYNVRAFGAVGDGNADDGPALQQAIDAAAAVGGRVHVPVGRYLTHQTLFLPAGVSLVGEGTGSNPRDMSGLRGSVLLYRGLDWAIRVRGDLAEVRDLAVYDAGVGGGSAEGGVLLDAAEGRYLESLKLHGLLMYRFTNGTGLKLHADAGGSVAYSSFYDVRVRSARIGYHLHATGTGGGSFVNSNSFSRGAISGGGFDFGMLIEGPGACNNNIFAGLVIEPYSSRYAHLHITGSMSQVAAEQIRIEALQQEASTPMIYLAPETYNSRISGLFSEGLVVANRAAHTLHIASGKFVGAGSGGTGGGNAFPNPAFRGVLQQHRASTSGGGSGSVTAGVIASNGYTASTASVIPGWELLTSVIATPAPLVPPLVATMTDRATPINREDSNTYTEQISPGHHVLRLSIAPGTMVRLRPAYGMGPQPAFGSLYKSAAFGLYARFVDITESSSSETNGTGTHNATAAATAAAAAMSGRVYATFQTTASALTTSTVYPRSSHISSGTGEAEGEGGGSWFFVSMGVNVPQTDPAGGGVTIFPEFRLENNSPPPAGSNSSSSSTDGAMLVDITLPSFTWGQALPSLDSGSVSVAGGAMWGTLSTGMLLTVPSPADSATPNYYTLPKDGNVFVFPATTTVHTTTTTYDPSTGEPTGTETTTEAVATAYPTIIRLNHIGLFRFTPGTVITLLFLVPGVAIADSVYIDIRGSFVSTDHCSITLLAMEGGTWVELSRAL